MAKRVKVENPHVQSWKRLISTGIFDNNYAQRVNASFQLLNADNLGYFTLRDFTERGKFVFSFLSINSVSASDTSFAIMDVFRKFDKNGTGKIFLEDFVVGIVEKLLLCHVNENILDSIAVELIPHGSTSTKEFVAHLPLDSFTQTNTLFSMHFGAHIYLIKKHMESFHRREKHQRPDIEVLIDLDKFKKILQDVVHETITDLKEHFHLSSQYLLDNLSRDHEGGGVEHFIKEHAFGEDGSKINQNTLNHLFMHALCFIKRLFPRQLGWRRTRW